MANNRLYIVAPSGEKVLLAKSMATGWYFWNPNNDFEERINKFFDNECQNPFKVDHEPTELKLLDENHADI